jgi:hypothetical protein
MHVAAKAEDPGVRFARWSFRIAGIVGLLEMLPLYFAESTIDRTQPPPITHPELYYGFISVVVAWQVAFLTIARDPARYRPLLPAIFLEKLLYPVSAILLFTAGRVPAQVPVVASLDFVWLTLFVVSWFRLAPAARAALTTSGSARGAAPARGYT